MLLEAAHNAGVITNEEYAEFQNAGYMGLYGGLTVEDIHKRKNLKELIDKILGEDKKILYNGKRTERD